MISLLARFFCKSDGKSPAQLRTAYGILCGAVGIGLNLLLFLGKFFAGTLSGSVAITADAFNNLSDAGSSVVTLLGFRIAAKAPDPGHPFGHGRAEYLSGLAVSMLILLMGVELAKESLNKILHPALVEFSWLVIGILAASICVKLYMAMYNRSLGKKLSAPALLAAAEPDAGDAADWAADYDWYTLDEAGEKVPYDISAAVTAVRAARIALSTLMSIMRRRRSAAMPRLLRPIKMPDVTALVICFFPNARSMPRRTAFSFG